MRFPESQNQKRKEEVDHFVQGQKMLLLSTWSEKNGPHFGLFNYVYGDNCLKIHLGRTDIQALDLSVNRECVVIVFDLLSVIPSHWIDQHYGGAANQFFKYVEFKCFAKEEKNLDGMLPALQQMLDRYQPGREYDELDSKSEVYHSKLKAIQIVDLEIRDIKTKWNLGQGKPSAAFENIVKELERRSEGRDLETATEMKNWKSSQ